MTEDDLRQFLEDNKADMLAAMKAKVIESVSNNLQYRLPETVSQVAADFITTEIVPEIKKHLAESKGPLVEAAIKASAKIGDMVAELLVKQAAESMTGYRSGEVVKALMGVR